MEGSAGQRRGGKDGAGLPVGTSGLGQGAPSSAVLCSAGQGKGYQQGSAWKGVPTVQPRLICVISPD